MADDEDTSEVASIVTCIELWLDTHNNKLELDLTKDPIEFGKNSPTIFNSKSSQVSISLGFKYGGFTKKTSLDELRSSFNYIALDRLPIPGLDGIPSQWKIYPQTPTSSFSEGVTLQQYDPNTQILQLTIETQFFAIYGSIPQKHPIAGAAAPKGTYLQVRRDIQGFIKLRAKLIFN
jgi:hypothetical protein